jgi:serine/threonine protein kinase
MEYVDGVDLLRYIKDSSYNDGKPLTQEQGLSIIFPILQAVSLLHQHHITHLDIKPENIILTKNEAKEWRPVLIDFGLSKHYDKKGHVTSSLSVAGCTDGFAPMEQYQGLTEFTPQADVYALGATLLFLLSAKWPAKSAEISADKIRTALPDAISQQVVEAVVSAMKSDKNERTQSVTEFAKNLGLDISTSVTIPIKIVAKEPVVEKLRKCITSKIAYLCNFDYRRLIKPVLSIVLAGALGIGAWLIWRQTPKEAPIHTDPDSGDTIYDDTVSIETIKISPEEKRSDVVSPAKQDGVVTEEKIPSNDELYAKAKTVEDFKYLADKGYSKAYAKLADLYLKRRNYKLADTYVRKAFAAGTNLELAKNVADLLESLGYYDDSENGSKPQ